MNKESLDILDAFMFHNDGRIISIQPEEGHTYRIIVEEDMLGCGPRYSVLFIQSLKGLEQMLKAKQFKTLEEAENMPM